MEISFKMTAQDYFLAFKKRVEKIDGKSNRTAKLILAVVLIALIALAVSLIIKTMFYFIIVMIFLLVFVPLMEHSKKKQIEKQFEASVVQRSMHTLRTYSEGLEIINSYEKMFVPWQALFSVTETPKHIIIIATHGRDIFAVSKERYASEQLDAIIAQIKANVHVEEAAK